MTRALLILLATILLLRSAAAQTLYVAPGGSDTAAGTQDKPLATLAGARDAARKAVAAGGRDITIYFADGTYRLAETVVFSREDSAPAGGSITYSAAPGHKPLFSGGVPVTGWRKPQTPPQGLPPQAQANVFVADLPAGLASCHTLFDGLERLPRSRLGAVIPPREVGKKPTGPDDFLSVPLPGGILKAWDNTSDVELSAICMHPWTMNVLPVASIDAGKGVARLAFPSTYPLAYRSVYVENVLEGVDAPGRWAVDSKARKIYLWPRGDRPGDGITAARLTELVRVEGQIDRDGPQDVPVEGIVFRGLTFAHGERYTWNAAHRGWGLQHDWEMWDAPTAMLRFRGAQRCSVEHCRFVAAGASAVRMDLHCQKNRVVNCLIEHVGGVGVLLAGYGPGSKDVNGDNEIVNNHLHHVGETYWHSPAIFVWQSGRNRIAHNRIHDAPYTGIVVSGRITLKAVDLTRFDRPVEGECSNTIRWKDLEAALGKATAAAAADLPWRQREPFLHARGNVVEYNDIRQVMQVMGDGNGIYVSGAGTGNIVRWNRVWDGKGTHIVASVRCDDDQHGTRIEGNLLLDAVIGIASKGVNTIVNNVIVTSSRPSPGLVYFGRPGESLDGSGFERNILYAANRDDTLLLEKPQNARGRLMTAFQADLNIYFNKASADWGKRHLATMRKHGRDQHSLAEDPRFIDPAKGDFDLRGDSPVRRIGFMPIDGRKIGLESPVGPESLPQPGH